MCVYVYKCVETEVCIWITYITVSSDWGFCDIESVGCFTINCFLFARWDVYNYIWYSLGTKLLKISTMFVNGNEFNEYIFIMDSIWVYS